jgi:hypothetical protein
MLPPDQQSAQLQKEHEQACADYSSKVSSLSNNVDRLVAIQGKLEAEKAAMVKMYEELLNNQTSDEPLDDDVLRDLLRVRSMTTGVIYRFFPRQAVFRPEEAEDLAKRLNNTFYSQFYLFILRPDKGLTARRRRLISLLFRELQIQFFGPDARRFGPPRDTETKFQEFERGIDASNKGS